MLDQEEPTSDWLGHPQDRRHQKNSYSFDGARKIKAAIRRVNKVQIDTKESLNYQQALAKEASQLKETGLSYKKSFGFQLRILNQVLSFIQKARRNVVLTTPNFTFREMMYVDYSTEEDFHRPLFKSQNKIITFLELIFLVFSLFNIWQGTFLFVFDELFPSLYVNVCSLAVFALEIYFNFNTERYDINYELITNRAEVRNKYFEQEFICDILALLVLVVQIGLQQFGLAKTEDIGFIKILMLLKFKSVRRIFSKIEVIYGETTESAAAISICSLLVKLFMFVHCLSLVFNSFRKLEQSLGQSTTWVEKSNLSYRSEFELYLFGWYWGATILTTVGFGDITPGNLGQSVLVSFLQISCCAVFAYCINYMGSMIGVLRESTQHYARTLRKVNQELKNFNVPLATKNKIRTHLFYRSKINQICSPEANKILNQAVSQIDLDQLYTENNTKILENHKFFLRFDSDILHRLALRLKRTVYAQEQPVFRKGDDSIRLLIIQYGKICEYYNDISTNGPKTINEYSIQTNSMVGFVNFVTGEPYSYSAQSKQFTFAHILCRKDFLEVVSKTARFYHQFCEQRDTLVNSSRRFSKGCMACNHSTHNTIDCPRIHYIAPSAYFLVFKRKHHKQKAARKFVLRPVNRLSRVLEREEDQFYASPSKRMIRSTQYLSTIVNLIPPGSANECYYVMEKSDKTDKTQRSGERQVGFHVNHEEQIQLMFDVCKFQGEDDYFQASFYQNILLYYNSKISKHIPIKMKEKTSRRKLF